MTPADKLAQIEALCRRYAHPGSNPGAHRLAVDVLWILEGKPEDLQGRPVKGDEDRTE